MFDKMVKTKDREQLIGTTFANNKYTLTQYLGSGSFSLIFKVKEMSGNRELAAKVEPLDSTTPQLSHEFQIYQKLRHECNHPSIPKTYFFGQFGTYVTLVLQLLGPSLAFKFEECGHQFGVKTVTLLSIQMIDIFQYIHSKSIIFRDVKPDNLLLGLSDTKTQNQLHLIDFGLAKEYKESNGQHIPYRENLKITGTVRYMSINANLGREQSRRDDMEAIAHLLIYFLKGSLPWSGIEMKDTKALFAKIAKIKEEISPEVLCEGLPNQFCVYLKTVRKLEFTSEPNYKEFIEMFKTLLKNREEDREEVYDWQKITK